MKFDSKYSIILFCILILTACDSNQNTPANTPNEIAEPGNESSADVQTEFNDSRWDTPPEYLYSPEVPKERFAVIKGLEGDVILMLHITREGIVDTAWVEKRSAHAVLDSVALSLVRNYRFKPAKKDGKPIDVYVSWPYGFRR